MKYVIVLGDGMADEPIPELGGLTPLEYAKTPVLDAMAPVSEIGLARTIPEGMSPGSDTANLSVLGYDPRQYYTGRSPLEALSIGVDMKPDDVALRSNLITVSDANEPYEEKVIIDHSSGEISTEDAAVLIQALKDEFARGSAGQRPCYSEGYTLYAGTSYRHLLIQNNGKVSELTAPHDILTRRIGEYLPSDPVLRDMMVRSYDILKDHPINVRRREEGKNPANSAWFWGAGTRPALSSFEKKNGVKGAMISAVDLLKGIAVGAEMHNIIVEGANGGLHTNYRGKGEAAVKALTEDGYDFVYVHIEAPDEMGHQGSAEDKISAIEYIDDQVVGLVTEKLDKASVDYRMLIMPDHPTPVRVRTHTADPVPYMIYDSTRPVQGKDSYSEKSGQETGVFVKKGYTLIDRLLEK